MTDANGWRFDEHIREVTDEEVASFNEDGWVQLPGLVSSGLAAELLSHIKSVTGLDHDELDPGSKESGRATLRTSAFNVLTMPRLEDPFLAAYQTSSRLGEVAARLSGNRPMRLLTDSVIYKLPDWTGSGDVTEWHQDLPNMPLDRRGPVQLWLALCEITPEMGSMQHMSGSQQEEPLTPLGQKTLEALLDAHPHLAKYPISPSHHFNAGDAIAHDGMTLHFAPVNHTNRVRWAYTSYRVPAETQYTASPPSPWLDGLGLVPNEPIEHPLLPIVTV
jgi:hypothetical protein